MSSSQWKPAHNARFSLVTKDYMYIVCLIVKRLGL